MIGHVRSLFLIAQAPPPSGLDALKGMMVPMMIILGIMYFMIIRPQQRKEKDRRRMIDELKTGTRVLFGGGLLGTITNVKDSTFIIKIADNVKVEVARAAVSRVLEKGEKLSEQDSK